MTLVDVHLNWLNWFHFLIFEGDLLIMIDRMILSVTIPALHEKKFKKRKEKKKEKKSS